MKGHPRRTKKKRVGKWLGLEMTRALQQTIDEAGEETGLSRADLIRLALDVALPYIRARVAQLRAGGGLKQLPICLTLTLTGAEFEEMQSLYRSGVTDSLPAEVEELERDEFLAFAEKKLVEQALAGGVTGRVAERGQRFLAVYRQLV